MSAMREWMAKNGRFVIAVSSEARKLFSNGCISTIDSWLWRDLFLSFSVDWYYYT